jgi:hypothetical protein
VKRGLIHRAANLVGWAVADMSAFVASNGGAVAMDGRQQCDAEEISLAGSMMLLP